MKNIIPGLKKDLDKISNANDLTNLWRSYLGKRGIIKEALGSLGKLSQAERRVQGPLIQKIKTEAQNLFDTKEKELKEVQSGKDLKKNAEDIGYGKTKIGHLHPLTQTIRMMNDIFVQMGYSVMDGPEVESQEYNMIRLNVPPNHPAMDMQDTIYIKEPDWLLRTQTSSIEARVLEEYKPPFKIVCPGRVYRNEKVNRSNHFIFHQYQGIVVLPKVTMQDLFGTFTYLFKKMYGEDVKVRYRNKYYPEVEPGVGPDMQCFKCKGKGCPLCKGVGWIEMGGSGIIHPNVLKIAGIDKNKWMGFAFGLGLDRWAMAKYNISDIRTLLGGNLGYKYFENENTL